MASTYRYPDDVNATSGSLDVHQDHSTVEFSSTQVDFRHPIHIYAKDVTLHHAGNALTGTGDQLTSRIHVHPNAELHVVAGANPDATSLFSYLKVHSEGSLLWGGLIRCLEGFSLESHGPMQLGYSANWMIEPSLVTVGSHFPHANGVTGNFIINGPLSGVGVIDGNLTLGPQAVWDIQPCTSWEPVVDPPAQRPQGRVVGLTPSSAMVTVVGTLGTQGSQLNFSLSSTQFGQYVCNANVNLASSTLNMSFQAGTTPSAFSNLAFIRAKTLVNNSIMTPGVVNYPQANTQLKCTQTPTPVGTSEVDLDVSWNLNQ